MAGENLYGQNPYGSNIFSGIIDQEGNIFEINGYRKGQKIGVDTQRENELLKQIDEITGITDSYRDRLVELGVIQMPKTPEQIATEQANEQQKINKALFEALTGFKSEISELKGMITHGLDRNGHEFSEQPKRQISKSTRTKSSRSKTSNNTSPEIVA